MKKGMKWEKRNPRGHEPAEPTSREAVPLRAGSHVKPSPVRRWADMTPAERANVLAALRGGT